MLDEGGQPIPNIMVYDAVAPLPPLISQYAPTEGEELSRVTESHKKRSTPTEGHSQTSETRKKRSAHDIFRKKPLGSAKRAGKAASASSVG